MNEFEIGPIRPPSESSSLLIRVTRAATGTSAISVGFINP